MSKIKLGIVADFRPYEDYFQKFCKSGGDRIIEIHVLESDMVQDFKGKLQKVAQFIVKNSIETIAFHSPDRITQSVLFNEQAPGLEADKKTFYIFFDELKNLSKELDREILVVVHQGLKMPRAVLEKMSDREIDEYREECVRKANESYSMMISYCKGTKLMPVLENSPPSAAADLKEHFIDLAFEDMEPRLGSNGFVLDISHTAMCIEYFRQDKLRFAALESLRRKYGGAPKSLQSMENYVSKAGKNIRWIHANDANGLLGTNEGLEIGSKGSLIDFNRLMHAVKEFIKEPKMVLELVNSHKDYSLIERSFEKLKPIS